MIMLEQIQEIMQAFLGDSIAPIDRDARLYTDLGLKSLDLINIVGMIEDKFDIEIPDEALRGFATVKDLLDYLEAHCGA